MTCNPSNTKAKRSVAADVFCGAGGLTRGLLDAGIAVVAGYDIEKACQFPYEHNNPDAKFHRLSVTDLTGEALSAHYPPGCVRVLVGCAPCAPFSKYTQGQNSEEKDKWGLLNEFARLVRELMPDIVSMENVPELQRHQVFADFLSTLRDCGFHFTEDPKKRIVYCPDYGMAQRRSRLVVVASRLGPIEILPPTRTSAEYENVRSALEGLPKLAAGEVCADDPLHRCSGLKEINLQRLRASTPGGSWREWPLHLVADCHRAEEGKTYPSVYGRMEWDDLSPTITTQFFGFGNGRFGHPDQDRAISLREGAILQTFPRSYQFVPPEGEYHFKTIGRMIGNAVPVRLGEIVGRTITQHLEVYE